MYTTFVSFCVYNINVNVHEKQNIKEKFPNIYINKVRDITLYHFTSLCIRKAAPRSVLCLAKDSNIAATCNMLFNPTVSESIWFFAGNVHR